MIRSAPGKDEVWTASAGRRALPTVIKELMTSCSICDGEHLTEDCPQHSDSREGVTNWINIRSASNLLGYDVEPLHSGPGYCLLTEKFWCCPCTEVGYSSEMVFACECGHYIHLECIFKAPPVQCGFCNKKHASPKLWTYSMSSKLVLLASFTLISTALTLRLTKSGKRVWRL